MQGQNDLHASRIGSQHFLKFHSVFCGCIAFYYPIVYLYPGYKIVFFSRRCFISPRQGLQKQFLWLIDVYFICGLVQNTQTRRKKLTEKKTQKIGTINFTFSCTAHLLVEIFWTVLFQTAPGLSDLKGALSQQTLGLRFIREIYC